MKKKKVLKIVLTVFLSLILLVVIAACSIFQFVIKPHTQEITVAVEQLINELETPEIPQEDIETGEELIGDNLSEFLIEGIGENETDTKPKKSQSEYNSTYDYVKDNVDSNDFKKGVSFASRIDIAYILGLLKDGLTIPEKRELKAYLKERFSNEEISEGISLYNKYSYLLK